MLSMGVGETKRNETKTNVYVFCKVRVAWHKLTGQRVAVKTYEKAKIKVCCVRLATRLTGMCSPQ